MSKAGNPRLCATDTLRLSESAVQVTQMRLHLLCAPVDSQSEGLAAPAIEVRNLRPHLRFLFDVDDTVVNLSFAGKQHA